MAFRKGYRAELELVKMLREQGFYAVRIPISGSREIPCDIIAAKGNDKRAYQVKECSKDKIYINEEQIARLIEFARAFGFKPIIAVRWKRARVRKWTFIEVTEVKSIKVERFPDVSKLRSSLND
ncbi:MAG: Holliday junction resolvase [Thermoprotei archaeon]|nr:MAG: Holliday junction resolvase [Thermoprotei archaeon]RLF19336.1 MAG: Holliday junction resolvase [Thermoprotei archaeon]